MESTLRGYSVDLVLNLEGIPAIEPGESQVQQLLHRLALMIAGDPVMQVPPHALDRVAVRAVLRQEVQVDPVAMLPEVYRHLVAGVAFGAVADDVNPAVAAESKPQVVQVGK